MFFDKRVCLFVLGLYILIRSSRAEASWLTGGGVVRDSGLCGRHYDKHVGFSTPKAQSAWRHGRMRLSPLIQAMLGGRRRSLRFPVFNSMPHKRLSIRNLLESFKHAWEGVLTFFFEESHALIHLLGAVAVIGAGIVCHVTRLEWVALVVSIALVFCSEIINTSIELLSDVVCQEKNEQIRKVKDLAAASVLFATLAAVVIGALIFVPRIADCLHR